MFGLVVLTSSLIWDPIVFAVNLFTNPPRDIIKLNDDSQNFSFKGIVMFE